MLLTLVPPILEEPKDNLCWLWVWGFLALSIRAVLWTFGPYSEISSCYPVYYPITKRQSSWMTFPFLPIFLRTVFYKVTDLTICLSIGILLLCFGSQIFPQLGLRLLCFRILPYSARYTFKFSHYCWEGSPSTCLQCWLNSTFILCPACLYYLVKSWVNMRRMQMIKRILEIVKYNKYNNCLSFISGVPRYIHINTAQLLITVSIILRKILHRYCHIIGFSFREEGLLISGQNLAHIIEYASSCAKIWTLMTLENLITSQQKLILLS